MNHKPKEEHYILLLGEDLQFLKLLKILLEGLGFIHLTITVTNKTLTSIKNECIDLCLIDIDYTKVSTTNVKILEWIRGKYPDVPLILFSSRFRLETYYKIRTFYPSSFMPKELSKLKLLQAIDSAIQQRAIQKKLADKNILNKDEQTCFLKIGESYKAISLKDIGYFFSKEKITYAWVQNRQYPINMTLKHLEIELPDYFERIHKSYIINIFQVDEINPKLNQVRISQLKIPIGNAYKNRFMKTVNLIK